MVCMALPLGDTESSWIREVLVLVITTTMSRLPTLLLEVKVKVEYT